ncbi:MAG: hypothetical protein OHK0040_09310 [bacterium]
MVYYYMGSTFQEGFILQTFIPVKFEKLKELLIDVSKGININREEGSYKIKTDINAKSKVLTISNPGKGEIKVILEAER